MKLSTIFPRRSAARLAVSLLIEVDGTGEFYETAKWTVSQQPKSMQK